MNASVVRTVILTNICWTGGSFTASELCSISLSIIQSHSRISLSPLWIFHQQTLTHKQMPLWHRRTVSTVAICSLAVQAAPALMPLSSEVCASLDRKYSETYHFYPEGLSLLLIPLEKMCHSFVSKEAKTLCRACDSLWNGGI